MKVLLFLCLIVPLLAQIHPKSEKIINELFSKASLKGLTKFEMVLDNLCDDKLTDKMLNKLYSECKDISAGMGRREGPMVLKQKINQYADVDLDFDTVDGFVDILFMIADKDGDNHVSMQEFKDHCLFLIKTVALPRIRQQKIHLQNEL